MPHYLLLSLMFMLPPAFAELAATPSDHDLAYSLGASLGERLREEVPGLQLQALIEGLQQAYQNKPLALTQARIDAILAQHDQQANDAAAQSHVEQLMASERRFIANERGRAGVHELSDGVLMTSLHVGTGARPKADGKVKVRYVGKLPDGTIFDQNDQPQWFNLNSVIAGWQAALPEMAAGSKYRLVIPSAQAYGAEGAGDLIAPYTPLVFEIELLDVAD